MATQPISEIHAAAEPQASWLPMLVIAMAQILMIFNVSSLQVSIDGIVSSFSLPATAVATAIVTYSLVVAGLIMLGARMVMAISSGKVMLILAQVLAGVAAAALVPVLVVLIAENYRGSQQEKAL